MKCVLFSEQHLSNNVGEIVFKMNSSLLAIHSFFLSGPLLRGNAIAIVVSLSPGEKGREHSEVFHK